MVKRAVHFKDKALLYMQSETALLRYNLNRHWRLMKLKLPSPYKRTLDGKLERIEVKHGADECHYDYEVDVPAIYDHRWGLREFRKTFDVNYTSGSYCNAVDFWECAPEVHRPVIVQVSLEFTFGDDRPPLFVKLFFRTTDYWAGHPTLESLSRKIRRIHAEQNECMRRLEYIDDINKGDDIDRINKGDDIDGINKGDEDGKSDYTMDVKSHLEETELELDSLFQQRGDRRMALCQASHDRLGANSGMLHGIAS